MLRPRGRQVAFLLATLALLLGGVEQAKASPITITGSGTWISGTPTSAVSVAGDPFTFALTVNTPVPTNGNAAPVTGASYLLNGVATIPTIIGVSFYTTGFGGLFTLFFSDGNYIDFNGAQVFTSSGDLILGTYPATFAANASNVISSGGSVQIGPSAPPPTPTPEPATIAVFGALALGAFGLRRRAKSASHAV